jgi:hypothetical protein
MIETVCPDVVREEGADEDDEGDGECGERDGGQFLTQHWENVGECMRQHGGTQPLGRASHL